MNYQSFLLVFPYLTIQSLLEQYPQVFHYLIQFNSIFIQHIFQCIILYNPFYSYHSFITIISTYILLISFILLYISQYIRIFSISIRYHARYLETDAAASAQHKYTEVQTHFHKRKCAYTYNIIY